MDSARIPRYRKRIGIVTPQPMQFEGTVAGRVETNHAEPRPCQEPPERTDRDRMMFKQDLNSVEDA